MQASRAAGAARAALLELGDGVAFGSLLAVEAGALGELPARSVLHVVAAELSQAEVGGTPRLHDAAVIGGFDGRALGELVRVVVRRVRPGGPVAAVLPTTRVGVKGATLSFLGLLRRRPPLPLEDLCEALLHAGLADLGARELADLAGTSIVWGRVREGEGRGVSGTGPREP